MNEDIRFAITILSSAIGGGLSAYISVRLALVKLEGRIAAVESDVRALERRAERLEEPIFRRGADASGGGS